MIVPGEVLSVLEIHQKAFLIRASHVGHPISGSKCGSHQGTSSSFTIRVVIFSDCRLPCVKTAMPDKTGKMFQIPG